MGSNKIFKDASIKNLSFLSGILYFSLYLYSSGDVFLGNPMGKVALHILPHWQEKIFRSKNIFLWEGIGVVSIGDLSFVISPLNILIAVILSLLVAANIGIVLYSKKYPGTCSIKKSKGVLGIFAGLAGGFACCVPTFIIILGPAFSSLTIFFIKLRIFLIPLSFILLFWGFFWGRKKIS